MRIPNDIYQRNLPEIVRIVFPLRIVLRFLGQFQNIFCGTRGYEIRKYFLRNFVRVKSSSVDIIISNQIFIYSRYYAEMCNER